MNIVTVDQPNHTLLKKRAAAVTFPLTTEIANFIDNMKNFILNLSSPFGQPAGLAAPQLGKSLQIAFIQVPKEAMTVRKDVTQTIPLTVLINPSFQPMSKKGITKDWEACYSVPNSMGEVWRYREIKYQYYNREGNLIQDHASGFLARLIQHEIGHLQGELYIDLLKEDCRFGPINMMMEIRKQEFDI